MTARRKLHMEGAPLPVFVSSFWLSLDFRAPRAYLHVGGFATAPWPQGDFQVTYTRMKGGSRSNGRAVQLSGTVVWFGSWAHDPRIHDPEFYLRGHPKETYSRTYAEVYGYLFPADARKKRIHAAYCDKRLLAAGGRGRAGGGAAILTHLILRALSAYGSRSRWLCDD